MLEENAKFVESFTADSVGMILKDDGNMRIYLKDHSNEKPNEIKYSNSELLMLVLAKLLGNKEFVSGMLEMFCKMYEAQKKAIDEAQKMKDSEGSNNENKSGNN